MILGFNNYLDKLYSSSSNFFRKIIIIISSSISSNIYLEDQKFYSKNSKEINSLSFITSTLNFASVTTISVTVLLYFVILDQKNFNNFIIILIAGNLFALNWLIKRLIDIYLKKEILYNYHKESLIKIKSKKKTHLAGNPLKIRSHFLLIFFSFILASSFFLFYSLHNILYFIFSFFSFLFVLLFLLVEYQIYKKSDITETAFFNQLFLNYKNMFSLFSDLLFATFFLETNLMLYQNYHFLDISNILIFFIILISGAFLTYFLKNNLLTFSVIIPIIFLNFTHSIFLLSFFISFTYYIYFLSSIHLELVNIKLLTEIFMVFTISILGYTSFYLYSNYLLTLSIIFIFYLIYFIISFFLKSYTKSLNHTSTENNQKITNEN